jgi:hypothetical protein
MNRREFFKAAGLGLAGFTFAELIAGKLVGTLDAAAASRYANVQPVTIDRLIWINLQGAPSQIDTFDPKPNTKNGGPFKAINTRIPNVQFSEHLPLLADRADKFVVIRSMTSREGNHDRARYLLHTGYAPQGTVQHPAFGSTLWKEKVDKNFDLPSFIAINRPSTSAGYLGVKYDPFVINDPTKPIENLGDKTLPQTKIDSRLALLESMNNTFQEKYASKEAVQQKDIYVKANKIVSSTLAQAFDLSKESDAMKDFYGRNSFGQGCLMATRLNQVGVKVVEVSIDGWDTHVNNFETLSKTLCPQLDKGLSALVVDLEQRHLLDRTLIVCNGEFGRTPTINKNDGRDHYPAAWFALMAGAGLKTGQAIGSTTDDGTKVVTDPVTVPDLYASLCKIFGLNASKESYTPEGRPVRLVDKTGKPIDRLFA